MSAPSTEDPSTAGTRRSRPFRLLPLLLLATGVILAWLAGAGGALNLTALAEQRAALGLAVLRQPVLAPAGFVAVYVAVVTLSLPGATFMTLVGGLLFGTVLGSLLAVLGGVTGACLLFLAVRTSLAAPFAHLLERRGGARLRRFVAAMRRDGFLYLLALRLLLVVPFWLVNLAGALAGVRLVPFFAATALGIVPGTAVFASLGAGLGHTLDAGGDLDLTILLSAPIMLPLCTLAALSLAAAVWRGRTRKEPECPTPTSP